jgi:hypothetical protein
MSYVRVDLFCAAITAFKLGFWQADGEQAAELHANLRLHAQHLLTHMSVRPLHEG